MASLKEYIKKYFLNDITKAGEAYFLKNAVDLDISVHRDSEEISITYSNIHEVYAGNRNDELIDIDILLDIYAIVSWSPSSCESLSARKNQRLRIYCTALVDAGIKNLQIRNISPYDAKHFSRFSRPLTDNLVPYLGAMELDDIAEEILALYYPEMLQTPMQINPYTFAQKLGLKVERKKITEDCSVFGRIYFEDDIKEDVTERTIVIESDLENVRPIGTVNNTIVHECLHWILHRYSIELEKGSENIVAKISTNEEASASDWREWQVHNLAPKIMMPKKLTQQFVRDTYIRLTKLDDSTPMIDIIEDLIKVVAHFFGVTIVATKNRLAEFGIEEAKGAFNFIDKKYIPPHTWKKGFLGTNQTFSIGINDLFNVLSKHESLRKRLLEGGLIYIDSHLCLNEKKYISLGKNGLPGMTFYARTHMDECCLVFEKEHTKETSNFSFKSILNNSVEYSIIPSFKYPSNSENLDKESKARMLDNLVLELETTIDKLPKDFGGTLKHLKKYRQLTNESLAELSLLSTEYISKLQNNHIKEPSIQTVLALCIGMSLPIQLSNELMKRAGRRLPTTSDKEAMFYELLLMSSADHTVEECNQLLEKLNYTTLTTKRDSID